MNENEMRYISGVGEQKLERYGEQFLLEIKKHPASDLFNNTLSDTVKETLFYHEQGLSVEQIAMKRENTTDTIYNHFSDAISAGLIDPQELLKLEDEDYTLIINTIEYVKNENGSGGLLKPIFEALDEEYSYNEIKCVMASY